ncbi:MAG TPA: efflux RND transporter periplasmic adaptor subunit [Methylomirabilota bacterium]|nr:efflux RND transporter periplasmic adaptor subunit [Methylomirabilota bacterium]
MGVSARNAVSWCGLAVVCAVAFNAAAYNSLASAPPTNALENATRPAETSPTVTLAPKDVPRGVMVLGTLLAQDEAALSVKVEGRLEAIHVDLGTSVAKGAPVAQVERRDYELKVKQAEAALAQARARVGLPVNGNETSLDPEDSTLVREARAVRDEAKRSRDRVAALVKSGVVPPAEGESTESAFLVAQSKYDAALQEVNNRLALLREAAVGVEIAKQQLADTTVLAPFDGVIRERRASPGEYLQIGEQVATLVRVNPLRLRVEIPERQAWKIRVGQPVTVTVEGAESPYTGSLTRVSPTISETNRMLVAEAELANDGRLRPGSFVRAEIVVERTKALLVPRTAVHVFAGVEKAYVIENGKNVEKTVRTGQRFGEQVEILSGLKSGDVVVRNATGLGVSAQ